MIVINYHSAAIGLLIYRVIFFLYAEAKPDTLGMKENNKAAVQDDVRLRRQNEFETTESADSGQPLDRNSAVNFAERPLLGQRSAPNVEPRENDEGEYSLDRLLNFVWPQSEKTELVYDKKQTNRYYTLNITDQILLGAQHTVPNVKPQENEEGAINIDSLDLFWPQSENPEWTHGEKQAERSGIVNYTDRPLFRVQRAAPNVEIRQNDEGDFNLEQVLDFFWPKSQQTRAVHKKMQADRNGVVNFVDRTLFRVQRAAPNVEIRQNDEGGFNLDRELHDEKQPDRIDLLNFADHTLLGGQYAGPNVKGRDTEEGATEPTQAPKRPADISYESNMLFYFLTITLPTFGGISASIFLCCYCMRPNGACCRLFDAEQPDAKPEVLEEEKSLQ